MLDGAQLSFRHGFKIKIWRNLLSLGLEWSLLQVNWLELRGFFYYSLIFTLVFRNCCSFGLGNLGGPSINQRCLWSNFCFPRQNQRILKFEIGVFQHWCSRHWSLYPESYPFHGKQNQELGYNWTRIQRITMKFDFFKYNSIREPLNTSFYY